MPRRIYAQPQSFPPKIAHSGLGHFRPEENSTHGEAKTSQVRNFATTCDAPTIEDVYTDLDGRTVHIEGCAWLLTIWGIHQIDAERWVQMSLEAASAQFDVVLRMSRGVSGNEALASVGAWLKAPIPSERVIHI